MGFRETPGRDRTQKLSEAECRIKPTTFPRLTRLTIYYRYHPGSIYMPTSRVISLKSLLLTTLLSCVLLSTWKETAQSSTSTAHALLLRQSILIPKYSITPVYELVTPFTVLDGKLTLS